MLTYGLGRGLEAYDYCTVEEIRHQLAADDYRIHNIIFGIVESRAFQYRGVAGKIDRLNRPESGHAVSKRLLIAPRGNMR